MAYTALYRDFRPLKFSDMVGQEHITRTLKNQIIAGRVGHAYLFNGGRGTGKTTSAKILARAVNCLNPVQGEPCNECEICKEILEGSLTDIVEMDAASNNGVDDIRQIRDEVNFLPTKAKYRVYIIDEVHMLSLGAFNALLKTLEEPPAHVKFILATTEPQKLPTTILSRCQRFDFKRIPEEDIIKRLKIICKEANINVTEDALKIMAVLSEGHMRDAISILERCSQESTENITVNEVKELVGLPSIELINKLAQGIIDYDVNKCLVTIDEVINDGKDLYNYLWEVIKYFKDLLVFKTTKKLDLYSNEELEAIKNLVEKIDEGKILNIIYSLSDLESDIKWSSQKTIMFQTGIIKLCRRENITNSNEINIKEIENIIDEKLKKLNINSFVNKSETNNKVISSVKSNENISTNNEKINQDNMSTKNNSSSTDMIWKKIVDNLKKNGKIRLYTALINTRINEINDLVWEIEFINGLTPFNEKVLEMPDNKNELTKEVFKITGKEINFRLKKSESQGNSSKSKSPISDLGIDINIID